jgi:voltage-gated potassium channel
MAEFRTSLQEQARRVRDNLAVLWDWVMHASSLRTISVIGAILVILAMAVFEAEHQAPGTKFHSLFDAIYWMVVTSATVGYGDIAPQTTSGKVLALGLIALSVVMMSLLTATIASWLVERRIMEGKGMERINLKNHVVVCGWNVNARNLLDSLVRSDSERDGVVLINELPEQEINEILYVYRAHLVKFVRGDFVRESVLDRGNVRHAKSVIILADGKVATGFEKADERAVLTALTLKSMNPNLTLVAELVNRENSAHLRRAGVQQVVVYGEHHDFLLASAVRSPGVTLAIQEILNPLQGNRLQQAPPPGALVEHEFREVRQHFREKQRALVIGVVSEEEHGVGLNDILSADMSAIDLFIKKQFEGLESDYFFKGKKTQVKLNPPDNYRLRKNDQVLFIAEPTKAV